VPHATVVLLALDPRYRLFAGVRDDEDLRPWPVVTRKPMVQKHGAGTTNGGRTMPVEDSLLDLAALDERDG